jgi:hypothetical protein
MPRENNVVRGGAMGTPPTWRFMLADGSAVATVGGLEAAECEHGTVVQAGVDTLVITLEEAQ